MILVTDKPINEHMYCMHMELGSIMIKGIGRISIVDHDTLEIARTYLEILRSKVIKKRELGLEARLTSYLD